MVKDEGILIKFSMNEKCLINLREDSISIIIIDNYNGEGILDRRCLEGTALHILGIVESNLLEFF